MGFAKRDEDSLPLLEVRREMRDGRRCEAARRGPSRAPISSRAWPTFPRVYVCARARSFYTLVC